jgi:serine/threonine protein kinase
LLDDEFRACISDFGTAKILNANSLNLTRLAGTKGYLAPGKNKIVPYLYCHLIF